MIKNESKKKIDALDMDLQNQKLSGKNSDIKTKLDQVLKILPNLSQLYTTGDSDTKKSYVLDFLTKNSNFVRLIFDHLQSNPTLILSY